MRALWLIVALVLTACTESGGEDLEQSFRGQFEQWYRDHPPSTALPIPSELALLARHKPVYFLGPDARPPVDFYGHYIANGTLHDGDGQVLARAPDRATLNQYARDPRARFIHDGPKGEYGPGVVYGRVDHDRLVIDGAPLELTFLTYTLVFETSGVLAGLPGWQELAIQAVADPTDWHQLDHYVNVTVALREEQPIALMFQHHNYQRTWRLVGPAGPGRLDLPIDGRPLVDIALRSNEAYPHRGEPARWRAVSFMESGARFLVLGEDAPMQSGEDLTDPARRLDDLTLVTLPHADAFYTFRGSLGEARTLPGRSGPPGADYNTLAGLKAPATQLVAAYWYEGLADYPDQVTALLQSAWRGRRLDLAPFVARFAREAGLAGDG
ncbi:MAG: hypothetical protein RIM84_20530 [Alphaproteobacteria bacterium]